MNYAPDQLEGITFCKSFFKGYNKSQVNGVLSKIIEDYNQNVVEIAELKSRVSVLTETLQHYKSIEEAMQHCIIVAQHTSDEMKVSASEKAKSIIDEAELTSQKMVGDANREVNQLKFAYEDSKAKLYTFKVKSEALLQAQLDVLKQLLIE